MVKRTPLNAPCDPQCVVGAKVDVMHQDLHGLHVDDGDQLGSVELLVAVLCQTGRVWDDTKATVTVQMQFCRKSNNKVPTKEQKLINANVWVFF